MQSKTEEKRYSVFLDTLRFSRGYLAYCLTGKGDWGAFYALRRLFCATNGRINDAVSFGTSLFSRPYQVDCEQSKLVDFCKVDIKTVVSSLDSDGMYIFPEKVPESICDSLIELASSVDLQVYLPDGTKLKELTPVDKESPIGIKYDVPMEQLMKSFTVQRIASDSGLLAIAQSYFRAKAVQDMLAMWWSFPSPEASSAIAQLYHFDMDRIKFLKFFIYLTDVGPENGPHCYVRGSHKRLPRPLCVDKRHQDEEVFEHYSRSQEAVITGSKGSLIAVDTRGLHKGLPLSNGNRLIFQVEFSLNLFGMEYACLKGNALTEEMKKAKSSFPYTYQTYSE